MSIARGIATGIVGPIAGGREGDPTLTLHHDYTRNAYAVKGPELSFTRASTATYFDSSGVMQTAAINAMRKQSHVYEGGAWVNKGLLVEGQGTNLSINSSDLTAFTQQNSNITSNADESPDGANDFDLLIPTVTNASHTAYRTGVAFSNTTAYTWSIYAKSGGYTHLHLAHTANFNNANAWCNFVLTGEGSVGNKGAGTTGSIRHIGGGVYRCEMTATSGASAGSGGHALSVMPSDLASRDPSFAGDGTSGIYLWGAQLETGSFPTSYIPTTASAVTRSADVATISASDFSGFYNASEGTWVVDGLLQGAVDNASINTFLYASDGTTSNRIWISKSDGSPYGNRTLFSSSGAVVANIQSSSATSANTQYRIAVAGSSDDYALSQNGDSVVTDTSGSFPVGINQVRVGARGISTTDPLFGHIAFLKYFNVRKPNAYLESVTA